MNQQTRRLLVQSDLYNVDVGVILVLLRGLFHARVSAEDEIERSQRVLGGMR